MAFTIARSNLGKIKVIIYLKNSDGNAVGTRQMVASNEDDLLLIFQRIPLAFVKGKSAEDTRDMDNSTYNEANKMPNTDRMRNINGFIVGGGALIDTSESETKASLKLGYNGLWEVRELRFGVNAGLAFPSKGDKKTSLFGDVFMSRYLKHAPVSPYIGGGAGLFIGQRFGSVSIDSDEEDDDYSTTASDSTKNKEAKMGFGFFPMFGVEFLRNARMRLHVEARYEVLVSDVGDFGHGPMVCVGMGFF